MHKKKKEKKSRTKKKERKKKKKKEGRRKKEKKISCIFELNLIYQSVPKLFLVLSCGIACV